MTNPFQKATKAQLKARVALAGPTGSGKTWTMLEWLKVFAAGGKIAVVDTENNSASLYADVFDFDSMVWHPPYDPTKLAATIKQAEQAGYPVLGIDSLSHYWEGEGGTLDIVDAAAKKAHGNTFVGWKEGTPALRYLVDTILSADMHIVVTMRSKMEYIIEEDSRGKKVPKKVGMAPIMRQGVEYEFTAVGDIDLGHQIQFSKSRCPALADKVIPAGRGAEAAQTFLDWLEDGESLADTSTLVERLNALPEEWRKEMKAKFKSLFGDPKSIPVSKLAEVESFVDEAEQNAPA